MTNWLIEDYGIDFHVVQGNTTLLDLKNRYSGKIYILVDRDNQWAGAFLQAILGQLKDAMLEVIQLEDVPLPLVETVVMTHPTFDEDLVEEQLLAAPDTIIVLQSDDDHVEGVISNTVAGVASLTESQDDVSVTAFHPLAVRPEQEQDILVYLHLPELADAIQREVAEEDSSLISRPVTTTDKIKVGTRVTVMLLCNDDAVEFATDTLKKRWNGVDKLGMAI